MRVLPGAICGNLRRMAIDLAQTRDHALHIADHLPPATASIVRVAARLLEHARRVTDGESADLGAALAELPAHALGAFVRDQRLAARLSLRDLARRTGLSINTVRDLERGNRTPSAQTVARLLTVPELELGTLPPAPSDDAHRPNAWFLPKYDRRALFDEMAQTLNASSGRLEQTCLYLDDQSAADFLTVCSAGSFNEKFRAFPFAAMVAETARIVQGRGLDVIALGPGDGHSEVQLCVGLRDSGVADMKLYLLDVSHSLLTVAHKHAQATFGSTIRVDALHGDFRHIGRYPVLLPASAPHRRRCYVLIGSTLANVDSETLFLRDCLSLAAPGDLALIDFQLRYADPADPQSVRATDPVLRHGVPELHKQWFTGPLRRHGIGIDSLSVGCDLLLDCIVPGSYEIDCYADAARGITRQRYHLFRVRRYEEKQMLATLERHGWKAEVVKRYGAGHQMCAALLRRV